MKTFDWPNFALRLHTHTKDYYFLQRRKQTMIEELLLANIYTDPSIPHEVRKFFAFVTLLGIIYILSLIFPEKDKEDNWEVIKEVVWLLCSDVSQSLALALSVLCLCCGGISLCCGGIIKTIMISDKQRNNTQTVRILSITTNSYQITSNHASPAANTAKHAQITTDNSLMLCKNSLITVW